jgi:hypothetical protein
MRPPPLPPAIIIIIVITITLHSLLPPPLARAQYSSASSSSSADDANWVQDSGTTAVTDYNHVIAFAPLVKLFDSFAAFLLTALCCIFRNWNA